MSFKTITVMLLLSCLGATSTALGGKKEPPQNAPEVIIITDVHWLWDETSTTIQICTEHDLAVGVLSLVFDDGSGTVQNAEGFFDTTTTCANFQKPGTYKLNENPARYELYVRETGPPDAFFRGVTTFAITARTTLLTCGPSLVTKITWTGDETLLDGFACIEDPLDLGNVCYHEEDLTGKEFCFSVNDGVTSVNVCLNGRPIDLTASSDGVVSVEYFYYGDDVLTNAAADATLSLLMDSTDQTKLRAIVRSAGDIPGVANIYDCSGGTECLISPYTRKIATYDVCVEAMDDSLVTLRTATTTFTDMNLHAFDGGSSTGVLVELVFGNALADMQYTANLYQEPPATQVSPLSTSDLDCTSVQPGNACFGFLNGSAGAATVYVSVSDNNGANTIIVPYNIVPVQGLSQV